MGASQFQKDAFALLSKTFGAALTRSEFSIATDATDIFSGAKRYLPRLDLAVGPFNVSTERIQNTQQIYAAANHRLAKRIVDLAAHQNGGRFIRNRNPRCLLAIEIEFSGSSKLIMGDFTNASMMGFVGLVVGPPDAGYMKKIHRVSEYVQTLRDLNKAPPDLFMNVACLDENQFRNLF